MNEKDVMNDRRKVDDAGIRLAPKPLAGAADKRMPAVKQEFVITPRLEYETTATAQESAAEATTASDYQPTERDAGRRWKRTVRTRNLVSSLIMLIACAAVLLPFALAAADVKTDVIPFKFIPERFDVITAWIDAFRTTAQLGWKGAEVNSLWVHMVPEMILTVGLLAILINLLKAVTGLFGAIKPRRYTACAVVYLLAVAAVFIASLVGAENVGIVQIDFMEDFIRGWNTSEFFTLFAVGALHLVLAVICTFITPQRTGYTRVH